MPDTSRPGSTILARGLGLAGGTALTVIAAAGANLLVGDEDRPLASIVVVVAAVVTSTLLFSSTERQLRRQKERNARLWDSAEALRQSERRLHDFATLASDWFWEQDADLRFTTIGEESPIIEPSSQARIGKRRWELQETQLDPEKWKQHELDLLARKPFRDFRYNGRGKDGELRYVSISGVPVYDGRGRFAGYRGIGRDITAQVEGEAELRRARDRAEAANRAKSAFLAQMSHELRTPLNAIVGFSELISDQAFGPLDVNYVAFAADINAAGRMLQTAIDDVIEMSRLEAGDYELSEEAVDVDRIVQACLATARSPAQTGDVHLEPVTAKTAVVIRADAKAITQILQKVLGNAVKFTPAGGLVSLQAEVVETGDLVFTVTDSGIGIDQAALPQIFEPFYQENSSSSRRFGGSGLGLAISRRLAILQGGSLHVNSEPGRGTSVQITFPAARIVSLPIPART